MNPGHCKYFRHSFSKTFFMACNFVQGENLYRAVAIHTSFSDLLKAIAHPDITVLVDLA